MNEFDLQKFRIEIDEVNTRLIELFEQRMDLVRKVGEYKKEYGLPVRDRGREIEILDKCMDRLKNQNYREGCRQLLEKIMEIGRSAEIDQQKRLASAAEKEAEKPFIVGYQGVPGSYSYQAVQDYFTNRNYTTKNYAVFEDVVRAVLTGEVSSGMLPIENSSTGGIAETYDLLWKNDCQIIGEKCIAVDHNLLATQGATLENIKNVYSHPQGFSQCATFLDGHRNWQLVPYFNTARSAQMVSQEKDFTKAAIASRRAAELYNLQILVPHINDRTENTTRFVVIALPGSHDEQADKVTVVVSLAHTPGTLYHALGCFYENGLNMTNIESRPLEGRPWEYFFVMDFTGNLQHQSVERAIEKLRHCSTYLKVLGNYRNDS